ncbi:MAG: DUF1464 family protein [Promethearchaeota archaeon]
MGIDPGSGSFDFFGYEIKDTTETIFLDKAIPSDLIKQDPQMLINLISQHLPLDCVVAPSGFGLPLKKVADLTDHDLAEITLRHSSEPPSMGLEAVLRNLKTLKINAYIIPGVKHFPTIPRYRKFNVIDMGTADKVCSTIFGLHSLQKSSQMDISSINFILIEIGRGFSAMIAVEGGKIIDGIGGTNLLGIQNMGKIDGELAYQMQISSKKEIYQGGLRDILASQPIQEETLQKDFLQLPDDHPIKSYFVDQISKGLLSLAHSFETVPKSIPVLITGDGISLKWIISQLEDHFKRKQIIGNSPLFSFQKLENFAHSAKSAAQGAAFIAEGIMGGQFHEILEYMRFFECKGSVFDDLFVQTRFTHIQ